MSRLRRLLSTFAVVPLTLGCFIVQADAQTANTGVQYGRKDPITTKIYSNPIRLSKDVDYLITVHDMCKWVTIYEDEEPMMPIRYKGEFESFLNSSLSKKVGNCCLPKQIDACGVAINAEYGYEGQQYPIDLSNGSKGTLFCDGNSWQISDPSATCAPNTPVPETTVKEIIPANVNIEARCTVISAGYNQTLRFYLKDGTYWDSPTYYGNYVEYKFNTKFTQPVVEWAALNRDKAYRSDIISLYMHDETKTWIRHWTSEDGADSDWNDLSCYVSYNLTN